MTWYPTNANDITLVVSVVEPDGGTRKIGSTASVSVSDFTFGEDEDMETLSGIDNAKPLGTTQGNIDYSFSFTIQGEDAELFAQLTDSNGRANELQITAIAEAYRKDVFGARAQMREMSADDGDAMEYSVEGIAEDMNDEVL